MFLVDENHKIKMVQGDTGLLDIAVEGYELKDGDKVHFAVAKEDFDTNVIEIVIDKCITKFIDGVAIIPLVTEDTINLESGTYKYDIQIRTLDGRVDTIFPQKTLQIIRGYAGGACIG